MAKTKTHIVNSDQAYTAYESETYKDYQDHKYLIVTVRFGRDRSLEQNKMMFELYKRISSHRGDMTIQDVRSECKLLLGVPILYNEDEKFRRGWDKFFANEPYEIQLHLMGPNNLLGPEGYPVSRLMSRKQATQYIDDIMAKYNDVDFRDLLEGQ